MLRKEGGGDGGWLDFPSGVENPSEEGKERKGKRKLVIRSSFYIRNVLSYLSRLRPCAFARKENCALSFERRKNDRASRSRIAPRIYPGEKKKQRRDSKRERDRKKKKEEERREERK